MEPWLEEYIQMLAPSVEPGYQVYDEDTLADREGPIQATAVVR